MSSPALPKERRIEETARLMEAFAERTGLTSSAPPRRYLWTDAFAVCNFLALAEATGEPQYQALALRLVDQVHHVLGRHRADDARSGWLSGLDDRAAEAHPTVAGLRIGKPLPERRPDEPFDEHLEWERDGQYFHYLTQWMRALDQVARRTRQPHFNVWARELAVAAHRGFVRRMPGGGLRMIWKASSDLSRPLVSSMGQHDPLDGFVACLQLRATASALGAPLEPDLDAMMADYAAMVDERNLRTVDPLGLGGLLMDAGRLAQLGSRAVSDGGALLDALLAAARVGLEPFVRSGALQQPAARRLAFRELGLAIGLHAIELIESRALRDYVPLAYAIELFWTNPAHRAGDAWLEHRDINEVMLATCLLPDGWLVIAPL